MIVVAIIAVIAAVAVPSLFLPGTKYRLKKSSRDLTTNIRKARSMAIKFNRDVTITFNTASNHYFIDGAAPIALEDGISFGHGDATSAASGSGSPPSSGVSFAGNSLTFSARGFATQSGAVYVTNSVRSAHAVVVSTAGIVALREWKGAWQ